MISDPRKFVRLWLTNKNITIDERGGLQSKDNRDNFEIFDTLFLDYNEQIQAFNYKADKKIKAVGEGHLQKALDEIISLHVLEEKRKILEKIKFIGIENLDPLRKFVKMLTGEEKPQVVAVFAQFIWSIKRRMTNQITFDQIMPIIFGKQKAGKSLCVKYLMKPLGTLKQDLRLHETVDARHQMSFGKTYAVVIDEMSGADKTDIEALKQLITADEMDIRKLHGNKVFKIKQNVSLIGTTNRQVAELIYDPTGARRFYQVVSSDKINPQEIINSIDYLALWQGINENKASGYLEDEMVNIEKDQENLIGQEDIQLFLDEYNVKPGNKEIPRSVLYDTYRSWCESNGAKVSASNWFGRKLQGKGFKKANQRSVKGKNILVDYINESAVELHQKANYNPLELVKESK
jgi:hypothetical protein